jgi:hypothetical protein
MIVCALSIAAHFNATAQAKSEVFIQDFVQISIAKNNEKIPFPMLGFETNGRVFLYDTFFEIFDGEIEFFPNFNDSSGQGTAIPKHSSPEGVSFSYVPAFSVIRVCYLNLRICSDFQHQNCHQVEGNPFFEVDALTGASATTLALRPGLLLPKYSDSFRAKLCAPK